ncbi:MAG: hypothetical protein IE916_00540 [Epsilonproteobacteria bacterium]|nr:hypothetical protein [Campylobacterota bacterium]
MQQQTDKSSVEKLLVSRRDLRGISNGYIQLEGHIVIEQYQIKEHIHITVFNNFQRDEANTVTMQLDCLKLRSLIIALKVLQKNKIANDFRLVTGSNNFMKALTLGHKLRDGKDNDKKPIRVDTYFINMRDPVKQFGVAFDRYQMAALPDLMTNFCNDLENRVNSATEESSRKKMELQKSRQEDRVGE